MHWRRLAAFLLGGWLASLLFCGFVAFHLFRVTAQASNAGLKKYAAEQLLTYLPTLEVVEIAAGIAIALALLAATHTNRLAVALSFSMALLTAFLHFVITPEIAYLSCTLHVAAESSLAAGHSRLDALEWTYLAITGVKVVTGLALTGYVLTFKTRFRPGDSHAHGRATDW